MLLRYSLGTDLRATTLCVFLRCDARLPLGPLRRATHAHALLVPEPPALFWAPLPTSVCRSALCVVCSSLCRAFSRGLPRCGPHLRHTYAGPVLRDAGRKAGPHQRGVRKRDAGLTCVWSPACHMTHLLYATVCAIASRAVTTCRPPRCAARCPCRARSAGWVRGGGRCSSSTRALRN